MRCLEAVACVSEQRQEDDLSPQTEVERLQVVISRMSQSVSNKNTRLNSLQLQIIYVFLEVIYCQREEAVGLSPDLLLIAKAGFTLAKGSAQQLSTYQEDMAKIPYMTLGGKLPSSSCRPRAGG